MGLLNIKPEDYNEEFIELNKPRKDFFGHSKQEVIDVISENGTVPVERYAESNFHCIKLVNLAFGIGLKESKDIIDIIYEEDPKMYEIYHRDDDVVCHNFSF